MSLDRHLVATAKVHVPAEILAAGEVAALNESAEAAKDQFSALRKHLATNATPTTAPLLSFCVRGSPALFYGCLSWHTHKDTSDSVAGLAQAHMARCQLWSTPTRFRAPP